MPRRATYSRTVQPQSRAGTAWRSAATATTSPVPRDWPKPGKRVRKGSGDARGMARFTAKNLADDYVTLCKSPTKDLTRWLAEDPRRPTGRRRQFQSTTNKTEDHDQIANQTRNEKTQGLRGDTLPPVRGGMDAPGERGWRAHGVLARSRTRFGRYDALRQVRGERPAVAAGAKHHAISIHARPRADPGRYDVLRLARAEPVGVDAGSSGASPLDLPFLGARSAIRSLYEAKIEITRRSLPRHEIAAAVRALRDEQHAAVRALTAQKQSTLRAWRERLDAERFGDRIVRRRNEWENARAPPEATPG